MSVTSSPRLATVVRNSEGRWIVTESGRELTGPFETMAEGWRWIDRQAGSPINRAEDVSAWVWSKEIDR